MLGCFHLLSPVHLSFLYCHLPKFLRCSAGQCGQTRKSTCPSEGALPCSAQGRAVTMQALTAAVSPERPLEIAGAEGKDAAPSYGSYITGWTQTGAIHHGNAFQWEENSSHMPMPVARECAPLLTLRWHVSNGMAEGTDVPSAGSWEAGWMPIQMPLEFGFWDFFFSWSERRWKINAISFKNIHKMGNR